MKVSSKRSLIEENVKEKIETRPNQDKKKSESEISQIAIDSNEAAIKPKKTKTQHLEDEESNAKIDDYNIKNTKDYAVWVPPEG